MCWTATFAAMKLLVYVFTVWLLLLTGLPCPDTDCHAHQPPVASAPLSSDDAHNHDHKAPCSPFCHCTTCLGFSVPQPFTSWLPTALTSLNPSLPHFSYQSPNLTEVSLAIWQPPQA